MKILLANPMAWAIALLVFLPRAVRGKGERNDPVMAGYDLVAYHDLDPLDDGIPGSEEFRYRREGYLYYFSTQENLDKFIANPTPYLPMYGGFCAWGIAWEYPVDGWPWAQDHMGPPCGPRDGWALLTDPDSGEKRLYCSIWRSYQDDFNRKSEEGMRLANKRWIEFYGSLDAGPKNNGCYAWNWRECYAESIYDPLNPIRGDSVPTASPTMAPTLAQSLFQEDQAARLSTNWSEPMTVLNGTLTFQYTLEDVASIRPLLVVDLMYELDNEFDFIDNPYLAFGVAEQVMEGALVVCQPRAKNVAIEKSLVSSELALVESTCQAYMGFGMGIAELKTDPVQPTVRLSERNETHYHLIFTANLFACWSNPVWPARVLFARGLVSGAGDPMPHQNNLMHRQAVSGVEFMSIIEYGEDTVDVPLLDPEGPPKPLELEPLSTGFVAPVENTAGSVEILEGRVALEYELFHYSAVDEEEVVHVSLSVPYDPQDEEHAYVGFGFSMDTMTGLIMTCTPHLDDWRLADDTGKTEGLGNLTATCHQWRGEGSNLYPRSLLTDAGGWFLQSVVGSGTHVTYTLAGRVADVVAGGRLAADTNLRAICALGRSAPDTSTPLMHTSRDRTALVLDQLASGAPKSDTTQKNGNADKTESEPSNLRGSVASFGTFGVATFLMASLVLISLA